MHFAQLGPASKWWLEAGIMGGTIQKSYFLTLQAGEMQYRVLELFRGRKFLLFSLLVSHPFMNCIVAACS